MTPILLSACFLSFTLFLYAGDHGSKPSIKRDIENNEKLNPAEFVYSAVHPDAQNPKGRIRLKNSNQEIFCEVDYHFSNLTNEERELAALVLNTRLKAIEDLKGKAAIDCSILEQDAKKDNRSVFPLKGHDTFKQFWYSWALSRTHVPNGIGSGGPNANDVLPQRLKTVKKDGTFRLMIEYPNLKPIEVPGPFNGDYAYCLNKLITMATKSNTPITVEPQKASLTGTSKWPGLSAHIDGKGYQTEKLKTGASHYPNKDFCDK